jgi:peptidoglycan/LPS O-acetylase OafA/YrhL
MGELAFICGSVAGAALALLIRRGDRSRSTAAALTGVSCGLLGVLTAMSGGTITPLAQAGFGFVGAAAPLTLCLTSTNPGPTTARIWSVARRYGATLALVLLYGTSCATAGFVAVAGLRYL